MFIQRLEAAARSTISLYSGALRRQCAQGLAIGSLALLLASCSTERPAAHPAISRSQALVLIDRSLPRYVSDRAGWADDLYGGLSAISIDISRENICSVIAVIEQESSFRVDPVIPGLGTIARKEIDTRAERAGVPKLLVHGALKVSSSNGRSYGERIDTAKTEHELSDIFEDFIARVPLGRSLFENWNPIRTRGPMQVSVAFVRQYAEVRPYPYPAGSSLAEEAFTRRGSLYFGIAHLLGYPANYDSILFRFADYNAGQYASRNAAFQSAVSKLSGVPLISDGALTPGSGDARSDALGDTQRAVNKLARQLNMNEQEIQSAMQLGKDKEFEETPLYQRVFALADKAASRPVPRAILPRIQLHGPKITRKLTTEWFARRVGERFERCLERSGNSQSL